MVQSTRNQGMGSLPRSTSSTWGMPLPLMRGSWRRQSQAATRQKSRKQAVQAMPSGVAECLTKRAPRVELTKLLAKKAEEARVVLRNCRRDAVDALKKMEKASEISEDDLKTYTKEVQDITDAYVKKVDEAYKAKEKEVLED